jgi:hypothetical protein
VIEAAVVIRTVPPPPVSEASQALYGERALAWRTDLHRVAEGFPELLEACWQYGVRLVAWRNQFNTHARDVGAVRARNGPRGSHRVRSKLGWGYRLGLWASNPTRNNPVTLGRCVL